MVYILDAFFGAGRLVLAIQQVPSSSEPKQNNVTIPQQLKLN